MVVLGVDVRHVAAVQAEGQRGEGQQQPGRGPQQLHRPPPPAAGGLRGRAGRDGIPGCEEDGGRGRPRLKSLAAASRAGGRLAGVRAAGHRTPAACPYRSVSVGPYTCVYAYLT